MPYHPSVSVHTWEIFVEKSMILSLSLIYSYKDHLDVIFLHGPFKTIDVNTALAMSSSTTLHNWPINIVHTIVLGHVGCIKNK
jgi:hypothetical protein